MADKAERQSPGTGARSGILLYAATAAAALLVYANSLGGGFVFDDHHLIEERAEEYRFAAITDHFTGKAGYQITMGRYYRPMTALTLIADNETSRLLYGGTDPRPFHWTNLLIHAAVCLVLLRLLLVLTGDLAAALAAALLFAVHPIHTEAVSWISGRTDALCGLFYFAALLAYVRWIGTRGFRHLMLLFLLYAAALLSKEMAVTFPAALLLYDLTLGRPRPGAAGCAPSAPSLRARLSVYMGLALLTALFLVLRERVLAGAPDVESMLYFHGRSALVTAATMLQTLPEYARLLAVPAGLLYHYNGVLPYCDSLLQAGPLLGLALGAVCAVLALLFLRRRPAVSFACVFFYLALLPVMNIVPTMSLMADRFLYIPSLLVALLAADLLAAARRGGALRAALLLAAAAAIALYARGTVERNHDWQSDEALYRSAEGTPGTRLNVNLGNWYARRGGLDKAEALYREAIAIRPDTSQAWLNLGGLDVNRGERLLQQASRIEQEGDYGLAERVRGEAEERYSAAQDSLRRARELDPRAPEPPYLLGHAVMQTGVLREAAARRAEAEGRFDRAAALRRERDALFERAEAHFEASLQNEERFLPALYDLAMLCYRRSRFAGADGAKGLEMSIRLFERIQTIQPGYNGTDQVLERLRREAAR